MLSKKKRKSIDNRAMPKSQKYFKNLARNNVKNSLKNYVIYFITLTFGVCLLYSFNSIDKQFEFLGNSYLLEAYINMAKGVIIFTSIIICGIFAFLINYANQLLMRKRKKEFGIYITLGMNKKDIINIMFKENIIIASISFIIGIVLGLFVEQGLSIITANMIGLDSNVFKFGISFLALVKTFILFLLVLWFINIFNKRTIKKYELIDLLNSDKKKEYKSSNIKAGRVFIFFVSILIILTGYLIIIQDIMSAKRIIISLVFIIIGTYYFFISIADFAICTIKRKKGSYYKDLNMFIIGQVSSSIKTMGSTITAVCLIIFLAITIIPIGLGISKSLVKDLNESTPYDVTLSRYNISEEFSYENKDGDKLSTIKDDLLSQSFPLNSLVRSYSEINVYFVEGLTLDTIGIKEYIKNIEVYDYIEVVKLSEYNLVRKQQGLDEIKLGKDEFLLGSFYKEVRDAYEEYLKKTNMEIQVNNNILRSSENSSQNLIYRTSIIVPEVITIIVNDEVVNNLVPKYSYFNCNYIKSTNEYEDLFLKSYFKLNRDLYNYDSKYIINGEKLSLNISLSYMSLYIGIILLVSAGAILALHQTSNSLVVRERYKLLTKLGVKKRDKEKAVFINTFILYAVPAVLAIIHCLTIIIGICITFDIYTTKIVCYNLLVTLIILSIVYGTYFIIGYKEARNVIE